MEYHVLFTLIDAVGDVIEEIEHTYSNLENVFTAARELERDFRGAVRMKIDIALPM